MKTYLVALDHSERAKGVLAAACDLAESTRAKLVLFRAIGLPSDLPIEAYATSPDGVIDVLRQRAANELAEFSRTVPSSVPVEVRLEVGVAWEAIGEAGRAVRADIVIIGSHGFSGMDRLLGTTASRVVSHADRSVLVIRSPASDDPR
jgi:nucleotide-binding universal stress UspA family protein